MTSIVKFCPISGGRSLKESEEIAPHCYLLQLDEFTILIDCGISSNVESSLQYLDHHLKDHISRIDLVLLSFPDLNHLGGLPYVIGKLELSCPVYATVPVYKMGQMFLYDLYQSMVNVGQFDMFNLDDVDKAFDMITQLKFNQTVNLTGRGEGITLTPLPAGHMIGGALWKIVKDGEEEEIVYAVDFNHKREQHLNGCQFDKLTSQHLINRPSLLITDAYNAMYRETKRRRDRDEQLMTVVLQTMRSNGNVLICVDTAGRVLELAHMLDHLWQMADSGLIAYSLALLNNVSYNVMEFAKSQMEWMSEKLMRTFEGKRSNPFQFKHVKLCHSLSEVGKVPNPKVVLASLPDLETGFARELFLSWHSNPANTVILTSRPSSGTLGHQLLTESIANSVQGGFRGKVPTSSPFELEVTVRKRVPLTPEEIAEEEFLKEQYDQKRKKSNKEDFRGSEDLDDSSSSESSEDEAIISESVSHSKPREDEESRRKRKRNILRQHIFILNNNNNNSNNKQFMNGADHQVLASKILKQKHPMFPMFEEKIKWDDYGELLEISEWKDATLADSGLINNGLGIGGVEDLGGGGKIAPTVASNATITPSLTPSIPTKCVVHKQIIIVRAQILLIDFEGRSDSDAIEKMITQLKPRKTIVVRGTLEGCQKLAAFCQSLNTDDQRQRDKVIMNDGEEEDESNQTVFIAENGKTIDASSESHIFQVRLRENVLSQLTFQQSKEGDLVAWVDATLHHPTIIPSSSSPSGSSTTDRVSGSGMEVATLHRRSDSSSLNDLTTPPHKAIFVNEVKLSDFKMVLMRHGIHSEFVGGVLFCGNGSVCLKRHHTGQLSIDGAVCVDYYIIRDLLYDQYTII